MAAFRALPPRPRPLSPRKSNGAVARAGACPPGWTPATLLRGWDRVRRHCRGTPALTSGPAVSGADGMRASWKISRPWNTPWLCRTMPATPARRTVNSPCRCPNRDKGAHPRRPRRRAPEALNAGPLEFPGASVPGPRGVGGAAVSCREPARRRCTGGCGACRGGGDGHRTRRGRQHRGVVLRATPTQSPEGTFAVPPAAVVPHRSSARIDVAPLKRPDHADYLALLALTTSFGEELPAEAGEILTMEPLGTLFTHGPALCLTARRRRSSNPKPVGAVFASFPDWTSEHPLVQGEPDLS